MAYITLFLAVAFAFLIALFAIQNSIVVTVNLLVWSFESSLVLVILGAASLGFFMALSLQLYSQLKLKYQLYKASSQITQLEKELAALKPSVPDREEPEKLSLDLPNTANPKPSLEDKK